MGTFIGQFDWVSLLIVALSVSLIVEAIDRFTTSAVTGRWVLLLVSIIVTLLKSEFDFGTLESVQMLLFNLLLTMSIAILFYTYMGHWIVNKIFDAIRKKSGNIDL